MAARVHKDIQRFPVPSLPSGVSRIGREGLVTRSFDASLEDPIRLTRGATLDLTFEFTAPSKEAIVVCHTNLNRKDGSWRSLSFKRRGERFLFSRQADQCGVFGFRIKYSFDKGKTWIWDRAPLVHVHVDPAEMRDIRCYTMIPTVTGTVDRWIEKLDHVAHMNFNMVHILPVTHMDGSESPYSAKDLFALDPSFYKRRARDGMAHFERFVTACKKRNIKLCVDLVLNHIGPGSHLGQSAPDWIMPDKEETDGMLRSGCWHMNEWLKWGDLVKIHYEHPDKEQKESIWNYMRDYALFWANYANYTGGMVRLDNLHNSDEDFIPYLLSELRKTYPNLVIHAEFFSDGNTVLKRARQWDLNLFLANPWEYPYAEDLREYLEYCHDVGNRVPHYMPATTHDTGAPVELFGSTKAIVPRYLITALCSTGQTGLVQGVEYGVEEKVRFIGRNRDFPYEQDNWIVNRIQRINHILATHDYLHVPGNITFVDDDHGAVIGVYRTSEENPNEGMLLFANLDISAPHHLKVDLKKITGAQSHRLKDLMDNTFDIQARATHKFVIPPCGALAYRVTLSAKR